MSEEMKKDVAYGADQIQILEGLEAVRKRPGMYIGSTSERGLHHLVYEIVDNSVDESLAGYCNNIEVTIEKDNSITVLDDGRGIPVDINQKAKKSALEEIRSQATNVNFLFSIIDENSVKNFGVKALSVNSNFFILYFCNSS